MNADLLAAYFTRPAEALLEDPRREAMHTALLEALEQGRIRAAGPLPDGTWQVNAWVKQAILTGFRISSLVETGDGFLDKAAFPVRRFTRADGVRFIPGGSAVRRGSFVAPGVVIVPPAYVNVGAWIGAGSMVDSHALVGSCAQIGERVHLSAGAQVGGVLEPAGARPVIVEDDVFVGGLVGIFEGIRVRCRAVLASGVTLTGSSVLHDLVLGRTWQGEVPEGAVVVPGTRPARGAYAGALGLQVATPLIVKYRDAHTDGATTLEDALR